MFGGGLALGSTLFASGAANYIVDLLPDFSTNFVIIILVISAMSNYITDIVPNTAFVSTFAPIFLLWTKNMGINPIFVILSVSIAGSMDFTLPTGTPPNAIVYKTRYFRISEMVKTGLILETVSLFLWVLYMIFLNGFFNF